MIIRIGMTLVLVSIIQIHQAQNLPSLLLDRNINSTFSILAFDKDKKEWGIAVATNNLYVGNSTIYITPGVGAFSVIAETEPSYALNGFEQLKKGKNIEQAILFTKTADKEHFNRQVAGVDAKGNVYAFTGDALKYWMGNSTHISGNGYVVMGNQLAESVLSEMANSFEKSSGSLAERLLISLMAGQKAGGQITGKQSAALVVKGSNNEWFNQIDLRVDHSETPFEDLQKLLNYHYGRISINQSINALKRMNTQVGKDLLARAELLVDGWNGIYSKMAMAYILLGEDDKAVRIIQKALTENPKWKEYLPAFYCLAQHPELRQTIHVDSFSIKDWNSAISFLIELNRNQQSIDLAKEVLEKYPKSSYTNYLLGKSNSQAGNITMAKENLKKALLYDKENAEALKLLK